MKMKTVLLFLAVVIACIATAHSASPLDNWKDEIKELNREYSLEHQEQGPIRLNCFTCTEDCANTEESEECGENFACSTLRAVNTVTDQELTVKVCLPVSLCFNSQSICDGFNATNSFQLGICQVTCCLSDGCNAEPPTTAPPTTPTTLPPEPPTTPTTLPPTTTPAPQVIPLMGTSGMFQSPGFPNAYPPNVDITWTISGGTARRGRGVFLDFLAINTDFGQDIVTIRQGGRLKRRVSGNSFPFRGKRSLPLSLFQEDGPCERDRDEVDDHGDDTTYDSLAAAYDHYLYRRQRPRLRLCIVGNNQQITINFSSDGNDSGATGFRVRFRVRRGDDRK